MNKIPPPTQHPAHSSLGKHSIFYVSLALNAVFVLLIAFSAYYKREAISEKIMKGRLKQDRTEQILATFNNEPLEFVNDSLMMDADSTLSLLFLGNSLTYSGVPDEEEDKTLRGLTSTSIDKDYVHRLVKMIAEEKQVNVRYSVTNIADFERGFSKFEYNIKDWLSESKVQRPDYLIVQIGENVAADDLSDPSVFQREYVRLLSCFPQTKKIITLPFWPDKVKQKTITEVALEAHAYLVDLAHLGDGTDLNNFASSYKYYKQPGVGAHPGDYGMENIAKCIFTVINAL